MANKMKAQAECKACGAKFVVDSTNVKKWEYKGKGNETIWLTHYDCPECACRHYVQIDNADTNGILVEIQKIMASVVKAQRANKSVKSKQAKYNKATTDLAATRSRLMKEYHGQEVTGVYGETVTVEFMVC